jgi:hypothetical protein
MSRNEPAPSFKAINGADGMTISNVTLQITYSRARPDKLRDNWKFTRYLRSTSFECLGIRGPTLPLRLEPYAQASWILPPYIWQFPRTVRVEGISYDQWVELRLIVEASGQTMPSSLLRYGHGHPTFNFLVNQEYNPDLGLVEVLERTEAAYGAGKLWIGLYEWLVSLIKKNAIYPY